MKIKFLLPTLALVPFAAASADITIVKSERGFLGSNKAQVTTAHNGSDQINFDATGVDKLVESVTITLPAGLLAEPKVFVRVVAEQSTP